jgi:hypothetical protein
MYRILLLEIKPSPHLVAQQKKHGGIIKPVWSIVKGKKKLVYKRVGGKQLKRKKRK